MGKYYELILSAADAEVLAQVLAERRRQFALEAAAADALSDLVVEARLVPDHELPADRVAMTRTMPAGEPRPEKIRTKKNERARPTVWKALPSAA